MRISRLASATVLLIASMADAQWIDTKTGRRVADWPSIGGHVIRGMDRNQVYDPDTGRNFARDECGYWIDTKTGKRVANWPSVGGRVVRGMDPDRVFDPETGRNFARAPCPPPKEKTTDQPPKTGEQVGSVPALQLNGFDERILNIHNAERTAVGVPPLRWNPALEASATEYARQLASTDQRVHAPREGRGDVRENLNQGLLGWNADQMLRNWLDEKRNFKPGIYPDVCTGDWTKCGHYTQIIWPTTTDIGCGMAPGGRFQWLVCRYEPGGNRDGKPVGQPRSTAGIPDNVYTPVPGFAVGPPRAGVDVNVCSGQGSSSAGSGADQDAASNAVLDALFKCEGGKDGMPVGQRPAVATVTSYQWIDTKTLKPVLSWPVDSKGQVIRPSLGNPNYAYDPETGRNFARENGVWIDTKTLRPVLSWPVDSKGQAIRPNTGDPNSAYDPETGRNFAKEPVPATSPAKN